MTFQCNITFGERYESLLLPFTWFSWKLFSFLFLFLSWLCTTWMKRLLLKNVSLRGRESCHFSRPSFFPLRVSSITFFSWNTGAGFSFHSSSSFWCIKETTVKETCFTTASRSNRMHLQFEEEMHHSSSLASLTLGSSLVSAQVFATAILLLYILQFLCFTSSFLRFDSLLFISFLPKRRRKKYHVLLQGFKAYRKWKSMPFVSGRNSLSFHSVQRFNDFLSLFLWRKRVVRDTQHTQHTMPRLMQRFFSVSGNTLGSLRSKLFFSLGSLLSSWFITFCLFLLFPRVLVVLSSLFFVIPSETAFSLGD